VTRQTDLALLTDDWHVILKFNIVEQSLQEHVGNSNQAVIFLRLVEWIVPAGRSIILANTAAVGFNVHMQTLHNDSFP